MDDQAIRVLIAKDEIKELAALYSRGVDRRDFDLVRSLYTADATDNHGDFFEGSAADFIAKIEIQLPQTYHSAHHICNHLISVNGDLAEGEVYCLSHTLMPDGKGGVSERLANVRYMDQYVRQDGRWWFAVRTLTTDLVIERPVRDASPPSTPKPDDASFEVLGNRLFARGPREGCEAYVDKMLALQES